ncbi:MAG: CehA/McbA family metallohydrolase [Bacteroidales bacterium]
MRPTARFALLSLLLTFTASAWAQQATGTLRWFKGNTHTHTVNSDGDSTPDAVVTWYREQRYHFLVITDHNFVTPVDALNALHAADGRFLVMAGEEVTDQAAGKPVHLNVVGSRGVLVTPQGGTTPADALRRDVEAMRDAGGLIQINHPNFEWALSPGDMLGAGRANVIEVFNGHPQVNNLGGGGAAGSEAIWDSMLGAGQRIYAVASDDEHELKRVSRQAANPGRGWVMVRAAALTQAAILDAMRRGDFYATTGVELSDVQATSKGLTVAIKPQGTAKYLVQFIGPGGRLLKEATSNPAQYDFAGGEMYVRAKVIDSNGWIAWTQPAWPDK